MPDSAMIARLSSQIAADMNNDPRCMLAMTRNEWHAEFSCRLLAAVAAEAVPDCYAVLTPNGSKLVSPQEAKGLLKAYPLYAAPQPAPNVEALVTALRSIGEYTLTGQECGRLARNALAAWEAAK